MGSPGCLSFSICKATKFWSEVYAEPRRELQHSNLSIYALTLTFFFVLFCLGKTLNFQWTSASEFFQSTTEWFGGRTASPAVFMSANKNSKRQSSSIWKWLKNEVLTRGRGRGITFYIHRYSAEGSWITGMWASCRGASCMCRVSCMHCREAFLKAAGKWQVSSVASVPSVKLTNLHNNITKLKAKINK